MATTPVTGKGTWTNFDDYWRDADIAWLQDRVVLRYLDNTERDTNLGVNPANGQVVYNSTLGVLQLRHSGAWKNYGGIPSNLVVTTDTTTSAGFAHALAGNKGIVYSASEVHVTHDFNVNNGILTVKSVPAGVSIKTGAKKATFTTGGTHLIVDQPFAASVFRTDGTGLVIDAETGQAKFGAVTASTVTTTAGISVGGPINAESGTIGNIKFQNNEIIAPINEGLRAGDGWFYGGANAAIMRQKSGSTASPNYVAVDSNSVQIAGGTGTFNVYPQMRVFDNAIQYYGGSGVFRGNIAPTIYQTSGTPDPAYYPEGTIWIS